MHANTIPQLAVTWKTPLSILVFMPFGYIVFLTGYGPDSFVDLLGYSPN